MKKKKKQLQVEILQRGERNVAKIATHSAITRSQGTKLEKFLINYVSSRGLFFQIQIAEISGYSRFKLVLLIPVEKFKKIYACLKENNTFEMISIVNDTRISD